MDVKEAAGSSKKVVFRLFLTPLDKEAAGREI
jgi:hypothetical protein